MKTKILPALCALAATTIFVGFARAQSTGPSASAPSAPAPSASAPASTADPAALDALRKMGEYLRGLGAFQVKACTTTEDVLDDGQKLQFTQDVDLLAKRPNQLRMKITGDQQERRFFYNAKEFTLWSPRDNFYATVPAPSTLHEFIDEVESKYDIEFPLADLFLWGTPKSRESAITSATVVGLSVVDGAACTHYAFRQSGLDWQIWIQNGDNPLPRKIVLTTLGDPAMPQYAAVYTWNLAPAFNDGAFTFVPPPGSMKIMLTEAKADKASAATK